MASESPVGVLSKLATSVKNVVTGQSTDMDEVLSDVEETEVEVQAVKEIDKTVEANDNSTSLHKEKKAAVVHEDVKSHEHERVDTIVDKEIHQDHYHTTIQPIKDRKVLPTKHVYQENEVEEEIDHRDNTAKKQAQKEAAAIRNEKKVEDTTQSREHAATEEHKHIHHHIHETIQPVIERETREQKVIHTTNRIHETEYLNDEHHNATVAPVITMVEFEEGIGAQTDTSATAVVSEEKKPRTRSTSVSMEISMSDIKRGRTGTTTNKKKREATSDDVEMDQVAKVVKRKRGSSCTVVDCRCSCHH